MPGARRSILSVGFSTLAFAGYAAAHALAAEPGGCASFDWPLEKELAWMTAPNVIESASGATLAAPPAQAILLKLSPAAGVVLPVPPSGKPTADDSATFAGLIKFDGGFNPGLYQVTLSGPGWIEVVQNGAALPAVAHSGRQNCAAIRKSVRFTIGAGPVLIEFARVPSGTIRLTLSPAQ